MELKPVIPESLRRFLRLKRQSNENDLSRWQGWFEDPLKKKGRLTLVRAGEDVYNSTILQARIENGKLVIVVDRLLPQPEDQFWHEQVTFAGKLAYIEAGIEVITTFRASVGERVEVEECEALELMDITELKVTSEEYLACLGEGYGVELWLHWFGDWVKLFPPCMTVSRFLFDYEFEEGVGADGYAVPQARLILEPNGPEIPVQVHLYPRKKPKYEVQIEKIDGIAHQKMISIVEEIWRTASVLSQRRLGQREVLGYRSREFGTFSDVFKPHIVLLSKDQTWKTRLEQFGVVYCIDSLVLETVADSVNSHRCDLVVGDEEVWGEHGIQVERLLRSTKRMRNIPRIWLHSGKKQRWGKQDIIDFGAFDLVFRNESSEETRQWVSWVLGGASIGEGEVLSLFTTNPRIRYRLGVALAKCNIQVVAFNQRAGFTHFLEDHYPRWILLDGESYGTEADMILGRILQWSEGRVCEVMMLVRTVDQEHVVSWRRAGVCDIVMLDASLRQAASRIGALIQGVADE